MNKEHEAALRDAIVAIAGLIDSPNKLLDIHELASLVIRYERFTNKPFGPIPFPYKGVEDCFNRTLAMRSAGAVNE